MATSSLHADDMPRRVLRDVAGPATTYQLDVLATGAAEVVAAVGGWLCDRSMAGWAVRVWLADTGDVLPLRILGAHAGELSGAAEVFDRPGRGLAVSATLLSEHPRLTDKVGQLMRDGRTEIAVWGGAGLRGAVDRVHYPLSAAARIFKGYALDAAGRSGDDVDGVEILLRGGCRPVDSDLLPVD